MPEREMHVVCPHCCVAIERVEPGAAEVLCPSCGSSFRLEGQTTISWNARIGQKFGKFEVLGSVGIGAFGTVYKARDPELDRTVALKVPRAANLVDAGDVQRFLREARSVAQLSHPGIVAFHDVGEQDGLPYLVSDFINGITLADWLSARRPSFRESAELIAQIAEALHFAHARGVIHRDVKPSNIMLESPGREPTANTDGAGAHPKLTPKLMDFGLARRDAGEITMTMDGQVLGTPAYMSPEQARGEAHAVDGRTDVYSLGVILYQMLTGELPFRGTTRMLLHQVLHDEPRGPRGLNDRIPRDLETITLKCLQKEPHQRFASAGALAEDLRHFLAGEPIRARPVGKLERLAKWVKRRPLVAGLLATILLVTAAGVGGITWVLALALDQRDKARTQERSAKAQLLRAEWLLYSSQISLAQQAWETRNILLAVQYLDSCRHDFRGWEHDYLHAAITRVHRTFLGHRLNVTSVALTADGTRLASGSWDGTIKVWNAASGATIQTLKVPGGVVASVAMSADGKRLVSGSGLAFSNEPGEVTIWDLATGKAARTLKGHGGPISNVALSPDGKFIASSSAVSGPKPPPGEVKIWNAATGEEIRTIQGHRGGYTCVAFSADGKRLVGGTGELGIPGEVIVWDMASGTELLTLRGHGSNVVAVAVSPDAKSILSGSLDGSVRVWDAATGQLRLDLRGHTGGVTSVAWTPNGERIVSGSGDSSIKVWEAATGREMLTLTVHTNVVQGVAVNSDGTRIASGSADASVKVWDIASTHEMTLQGHQGEVMSVAFSPDGKRIVSGSSDRTVKVWDAATWQEVLTLKGHPGHIHAVAVSADGTRIVSGCGGWDIGVHKVIPGEVRIWDAATGRNIHSLKGHTSIVTCAAVSADAKRIVSGSFDKTVKLWDAITGEEVRTLTAGGPVHSVALSPDGSRIVSGGVRHDGKGQQVLGELTVWDALTGQETRKLPGHTATVLSVAFSHDGSHLVSGSMDNTVKVWEAATGREMLTLKGHTAAVTGVAISRDGKRIVSGSADKTVKVWEATTGQETMTIKGHLNRISSVALSPDDRLILAGSHSGMIKVWDRTQKAP